MNFFDQSKRETGYSLLVLLLSLEADKRLNVEELNSAVELLSGILSVVLSSSDSDSNHARDVPDALGPKEPVEFGVNSNILIMSNTPKTYLSVHLLLSESLAGSNSSWCSLFESNTLESLMHVKSVVSSDGLQFLGFFDHLLVKIIK